MRRQLDDILALAPVIPVITINDPATAVPLAKALQAGGVAVLEITLRTPHGLDAIRRIRSEVESVIVGAGTVRNSRDLAAAMAVGSEFIISPGVTQELLRAAVDCDIPFMPGIATVSELMLCLEKGFNIVKFFPAEALGGAKTLKAFAGPFPDVWFCPTGGISPANIAEYLALPTVKAIGGSWMVPQRHVDDLRWEEITDLAREAVQLVTQLRTQTQKG